MDRDRARWIFLHGFTQTGRSWAPVTAPLHARHPWLELVTPDLPGHGSASAVRTDLPATAEHLVGDLGAAAWIGYSLGGRVALHVALQHPEAVTGLVLIGATGGIDDEDDRADRRRRDEALADDLEADGVDRFLARWLAQPLFARLSPESAGLEDRRRNGAEGLAASLRLAGTGAQLPLWDRVAEIGRAGIPTLVLAGEHDDKFRAAGTRLVDAIGTTASFGIVRNAGHAAHLEQPDQVADLIAGWLA